MVAWKRFPVPEFNYEVFRDMDYRPPAALSRDAADALLAKYEGGSTDAYGGYIVSPDAPLLERFAIKGDFAQVVMCLLPRAPVHLLGRSWAWKIQRALILDSMDASSAAVLHEWKTPRPMNTRLGPEDGVTLPGGPCFVVTASQFADHWLGNRSIIEANAELPPGGTGFRILGGSDPDASDFHHTYLAFDWQR